MASSPVLIYGANGYTGRLIVARALERGLRPILAGRSAEALGEMGASLGLEHRAFSLDDTRPLDDALRGVSVVMHCAGPFSRTSAPMASACLRARAHYLDITGEIPVFESLAARDAEAKARGVMLLPGVGFDVVPSDCLAAHLAQRLPSATHLVLAFAPSGGMSRGTATTMVEGAGGGGTIRRDGAITSVPAAYRTREIDFGEGPRLAATIPWGDVSTAFYSTRIPNIEVYAAMSPKTVRSLVVSRYIGWLLRAPAVQSFLLRGVRKRPPGPSEARRATSASRLWGEVTDDRGGHASARLAGPEAYTLSALTAVLAIEKVLTGHAKPGFQTPSLAFGKDFVLEVSGTRREDLD